MVGFPALAIWAGAGCSTPVIRQEPAETTVDEREPTECATFEEAPGRPALRRLNSDELNNTLGDLIPGAAWQDDFPEDEALEGFTNNGEALTTSTLLLEEVLEAAEEVVETALAEPPEPLDIWIHGSELDGEDLYGGSGGEATDDGYLFADEPGVVDIEFDVPIAGTYVFSAPIEIGSRTELWVSTTDDTVAQLALGEGPHDIEIVAWLEEGDDRFRLSMFDAADDATLLVESLAVSGPLEPIPDNPLRDQILVCDPNQDEGCARKIVRDFARKAWRRPVQAEELDRYLSLIDVAQANGDDAVMGVTLAMEAILVSPSFLYLVEIDETDGEHALSDHELAARLSYFLWRTMPDEELSAVADAGDLGDPDTLEAQVTRMLADERALDGVVGGFGRQWLQTADIPAVARDETLYPAWSLELAESMQAETEAFFASFLEAEKPLSEFLTADYTYLDPLLAEWYGLAHPTGQGIARVDLSGTGRIGILTHGGWLSTNSYPTRTNPVARGKYVAGQLLCSEPPDPPPDVEDLNNDIDTDAPIRDILAQHRSDPECLVCHELMDQLGLAMEGYSALGLPRTVDEFGYSVDTSGVMPDGTEFDGPNDLAPLLADGTDFEECVTEKMLTYALGRSLEDDDWCWVLRLTNDAGRSGHTLPSLLTQVATSKPFTHREAE